jgi:hypothetical protein
MIPEIDRLRVPLDKIGTRLRRNGLEGRTIALQGFVERPRPVTLQRQHCLFVSSHLD